MTSAVRALILFIGGASGAIGYLPTSVAADTIAVIGTGRVATALGPQFAKLGHRIVYASRDPARDSVQALVAATGSTASATSPAAAAEQADIVVLATPWRATEEVVKGLGNLAGKIVIDPTNAYARTADGLREMAVETSMGELIQSWAPEARVVKAFNTLHARTMANPDIAGGPVTIPIVGNDEAAKDTVAELVTGIGLEAIDLGPIRYAHNVEAMLMLWTNARILGSPFDFHLRRQPANQ